MKRTIGVILTALVASQMLLTETKADVIDFSEFDANNWFGASSITSQGYDIASSGASITTGAVANQDFCNPRCPDNGGRYLLGHSAGFTFTKGGEAFSLASFDGGEAHNGALGLYARAIRVTGQTAGGDIIQNEFTLDWLNDGPGPMDDFELFTTTDFDDVVSLNFEGVGGRRNFFSLDNIVLNADVPEPGTLALFALGFAGMGFARRKRS